MIDPRTSQLLKQYMIAGGSLGAGIGVGTSMLNYLNYLKEKSRKQQADSSNDDDVLYVDVPHSKQANITSFPGVGGGMAIAGGTLSMMAANSLVRMLYNAKKKKMLQKDLDEAQELYWDADSAPGVSKTAADVGGKPMSTPELVASAPVALALLAAVASGAITNKALSHYFPSRDSGIDPIKDARPKQVKIRYKDEVEKTAAEAEIISAMDFAVSALIGGLDKEASYLPDLVSMTANGHLDEFLENLHSVGPAASLELIKGASFTEQDPDTTYLSICALNRNKETAPLVATLLEAEILDRLPYFHKVAYETETSDREVLVKLAAAISNDVVTGILDKNTDQATPEQVLENKAGEPGATNAQQQNGEKGYTLLAQILSQHKGKQKDTKDPDVIDQVMAGM